MKIENQVCTLEQAQKLKEFGVEQVSAFSYNKEGKLWAPHYNDMPLAWSAHTAAFTVAELGVLLPSELYTQYTGSSPSRNAPWEWVDDHGKEAMGIYDTEAQARAALLIRLLEAGDIQTEDCNERLKSA